MDDQLPALSFNSLLATLSTADEALADPEFDPERLVGDIRDKVDGLNNVETRMQVVSQWLAGAAKELAAKAKTIENNRQRLRQYVATSMLDNHFDTVPGELWKVRLRSSGLSVETKREPDVRDYVEMTDLVRTETVYSWDKKAIKAKHAQTSPEDLEGLPFSITEGYWPEFVPNVPEFLEKKKRKKKDE